MKTRILILVLTFVSLAAVPALGASSVVVESKTVARYAQNVPIGISVTNESPVGALAIPLRIRAVTPGSFITQLAMSWGGRMDSVLTDAVVTAQYATQSYECMGGGLGFGDIVTLARDSSRTVGESPEGAMFARVKIFSPALAPGTDESPSMFLKVSVTGVPGTFEIDTTCTRLANHLKFVQPVSGSSWPAQEIPSFTKGIITIAACDCAHHGDLNGDNVIDVFDLSQLIDYVFGGYPIPPTDQGCPHVDRGDVNCDGGDDVFDIIYLNDHLFNSGPAPCDPCACSPYPTNCP